VDKRGWLVATLAVTASAVAVSLASTPTPWSIRADAAGSSACRPSASRSSARRRGSASPTTAGPD